MEWDYIVIGAGSAGCAAAAPLVRAGRRVLVLEAGGSDRSWRIAIPAAVWRIQARHDWGYQCEPDPTRNGIRDPLHRGRVLGGTSSINGMLYVRGARGDFDRWAQQVGAKGAWSAAEVMPIFQALESSDQDQPQRGKNGALHVRTVRRPHRVTRAFIEAAQSAGHGFNQDYNAHDQAGVGYLQFTQHRGRRWSAADAFLRPLLNRANLKLLLHAMVERIETRSGRAEAVMFRYRGQRHRVCARDIVICAGSINSPKILMLSGIGDPQELGRHGIAVEQALPAVGQHLRDHPLVQLTYRARVPTYNLTQGWLQRAAILWRYLRHREGPIGNAYEAAAFLKLTPHSALPEVQVFFAPIGWSAVGGRAQLTPYPAMKLVILCSHARSSGRVRLSSTDPAAPPLIEPRLLDDASDVRTLIEGAKAVRRIMQTEPMADLVESEVTPGTSVQDDKAWQRFVGDNAEMSCHVMGTCRMGLSAAASVVTPDLRVHGMENLWIADASIVPDAISANLNAPSIMIGTKLGKQLAARAGSSSGTAGD